MHSRRSQLESLLQKTELTPEERRQLFSLMQSPGDEELKELLQIKFLNDLQEQRTIDAATSENLLANIHESLGFNERSSQEVPMFSWAMKIAAACIIGVLAIGSYIFIKPTPQRSLAQKKVSTKKLGDDVLPGGNKALLTLSDGSTISLDDSEDGVLATQGNTRVSKSHEKLSYKSAGRSPEILFNTITTPRGGQYNVQLPDGTQVWLNASSSIRFPTSFSGSERRVEFSGEVYFEVAKNKEKPFIASVGGAEIQVLGTHFNVKAYSDESHIETSLLEGSVYFSKDDRYSLLKPGQQSDLSSDGKLKVQNDVNMNGVIAWKNGYFDFDGSDFQNVARQLSRWYDVDVVYEKRIDELFYAKIPRNTRLSDVLKALELTGKIKFEIRNNRIIVVP